MRDFFHASSETDVGAHRLLYYSPKNDSWKNMCLLWTLLEEDNWQRENYYRGEEVGILSGRKGVTI